MSDLHLEWMGKNRRISFVESLPVTGDVLVLAGDITEYSAFVETMTQFAKKWPHVVHVPGNHEYYRSNKGTINNCASKMMRRFPNYHFLCDSVVEVDGVKFVGSTLWFRETVANFIDRRLMTDYTIIQGFKRNVFDWNRACIKFLNKNVTEGCVVITHHAPSEKSVSVNFKYAKQNALYYCSMEKLMLDRSPKLWIHGHMHDPVFYEIDKTTVISNPRGYEDIHGTGDRKIGLERFVPELIFEV